MPDPLALDESPEMARQVSDNQAAFAILDREVQGRDFVAVERALGKEPN